MADDAAPLFARLGTWQGSPAEMDRWIERSRGEVKPAIARDPGLRAAYWLVDRQAGKAIIVTLWESEAAMAASEAARAKRQSATTQATGASVSTERFQVVDALIM